MTAVLLDIEGTIGDIAFVREVLFPFARARLGDVLEQRWNDAEVTATVREARALSGKALDNAGDATALFLAWMEEDRKVTPLKTLQGIIWREGYRSSELKAHLYPDAVEAIRAWRARRVRLFIYSSGSIEAQKLYVAHSVAGDLTALFDGFFDTTSGPKGEAASYVKIAKAIGTPPNAITFFSDSAGETSAASEAGLRVYRVDRSKEKHFEGKDGATPVIGSFEPVRAMAI